MTLRVGAKREIFFMHSRSLAYQIRAANAARQLSAPRPGSAQARRAGYVPRATLKGVGCGCTVRSTARIGSYKVIRAVRNGLSGMGAPQDVTAMIPVSDPVAVQRALKLFARAQGRTLSGFSAAEQAQGAASMAAAGAKVGSIVPGIGTVIGAVVGAVAGWIMGKSKPVRPSAAERAKCNAMMIEYNSVAAQSPNAPLPMDWPQLLDLNWCFAATYGADIGLRDPRWFNPGFESGTRQIAIDIVKKIYETPVGAVVNIDAITFKDPKGRTLNFKGFSFTNPVFTDLKAFSAQYFERMELQFCQNTGGKGAGGCATFVGRAERKRLLYDLLAWAARTTLPNISESDLRAASQVAATVGGSAKDVVNAVESIIKRNVARDETAALLTPSATAPAPIPPAAITPLIPAPPPPVTPIAPIYTPPVATLPTVSQGAGTPVLPAPSAGPPSAGSGLPGAVQAGVGSGENWMWWGAGLLGLAFVMPRGKRSRSRKR